MKTKLLLAAFLCVLPLRSAPAQTLDEIIKKAIDARGGIEKIKSVQSERITGTFNAQGVEGTLLLELKRPHKMRLELQVKGQTAVQVYDGANGWKLRPFLNRQEIEPFSEEERKIASNGEDLDGPLVDYAAKGTHVELEGSEKVEGRDTYKIKVMEKTGHTFHVWIDAKTFLEAKIEGHPRRLDGVEHPVEVYYRDYRAVDGLQFPFVLETRVLPVAKNALGLRDTPVPPEKITIDKVVVNPKFDEKLFSKLEIASALKSK